MLAEASTNFIFQILIFKNCFLFKFYIDRQTTHVGQGDEVSGDLFVVDLDESKLPLIMAFDLTIKKNNSFIKKNVQNASNIHVFNEIDFCVEFLFLYVR